MDLHSEEVGWLYSGTRAPVHGQQHCVFVCILTHALSLALFRSFFALLHVCSTAYSLFTPIMVFVSGVLIDKIGAKTCVLLLVCHVTDIVGSAHVLIVWSVSLT
jgi:hypothetical protein